MNKDFFAKRGLFVGIAALISAFYFFAPTLFTFKSSLIKESGEVRNVKTFYIPVESSRGSKSIKSELKFTLNSTQSVYVLMKNIGKERYNEKFEKLAQELKISGKVSVWIKENQKNTFNPYVFQIDDRNDLTLYDFEESKYNSRFGFLISFGVGVIGIVVYLRHKYGKKPAHNKA